MGTKEKLLQLLQENQGMFFSGEEIAEKLAVSRTAVWKAANSLRKAGFAIDAVQNRGYCLDASTDILSEQGIRAMLSGQFTNLDIQVLPTAGSTNALLREQADHGALEGCTIIANTQTQGRGRLGRSFYSPPDTGIYMSLLLRPKNCLPAQAIQITTMAAVAAARAVEGISGGEAKIKWVNDVFLYGRKVAGILTEASFHLESGSLDYIVLGIGMNAYAPKEGFPKEIANIAGAIFEQQQSNGKNRLAAAFLNAFLELYDAQQPEYAEEYRERSLVIGRNVRVITPSREYSAVALDIDKDCRLIVRNEAGAIEALSSGDVQLKL